MQCAAVEKCVFWQALSFLVDGPEEEQRDLGKNLNLALRVGEFNLRGLELLDQGHKEKFGVPSPTTVRTSPVPGKVSSCPLIYYQVAGILVHFGN